MTLRASESDRKQLSALSRKLLAWLPIAVGIIHQFLMAVFDIDRIYVFVNPPQYIYPWVSLEYQWWIVLVFVTALLCTLVYLNRLRSLPYRVIYPAYAYLVFLLIFVKPV
jgi:hypothetical protein